MVTKKLAVSLIAALVGLSFSAGSYAEEAGDWLVRGRLIDVNPNYDSGEVSGIPGSGVGVNSDTTVELDFTYFLDRNWALELILATTGHDIFGTDAIQALGDVAETNVLPPTLTLQYHEYLGDNARLYVGIGANYTLFYDEKGKGPFAGADVDLDSSFGLSTQIGLDWNVNKDWFMNLDVKYITMDTTAEIRPGDGSVLTVDADIDPWVIGIGFGTRF